MGQDFQLGAESLYLNLTLSFRHLLDILIVILEYLYHASSPCLFLIVTASCPKATHLRIIRSVRHHNHSTIA